MKVTRLDPEKGVSNILSQFGDRLRNLETNPAGNIHIRDQITTGQEGEVGTVFGSLPDGSTGLQEWINDVEPPRKPSPPTALQPAIGGIIVSWSGLDDLSGPQPRDYSHTEVEYSTDSVMWTVGAVVTPTSTNTTIPGLFPDKTYSVRLRSFDVNKNASEYSTIVGGGKTLEISDPSGLIEDLRNEYTAEIDNLESALTENAAKQAQLQDTITNLRDVKLPGIEQTITNAQQSIVSTENALKLIPGDISAAKAAAIAEANSSAARAIELAQLSGQSLITNGNMNAGQTGWTVSPMVTFTAAAARGGDFGMRVAPTTGAVSPLNIETQTSSGRTYYFEMWVKRTGTDTASTAAIGFLAQTLTTSNTTVNTTIQGVVSEGVALKTGDISTTTYTKVSAEWTVPAGDINRVRFAPWFKQSTTNVYFVDDMLVVDITDSKTAMAKAIDTASRDAAQKIAASEAAMSLVAQGFANKAKDDAISASLSDIIARANTAKSEAIEASRLSAELLAEQARIAATGVANTAQTAADKAIADALKASNLAAAKSKLLIQSTAPGAEDRNANTLWIDTSGTPAANIPKRWVSGTTWAAVTDKTATDAATLAAQAQAAAAQAAADALAANTVAGDKSKLLIQSTAPAAEYRNTNTLWIDTSGTPAANIPKRWTTGTTWVAVTDKTATDAATAAAKAIADALAANSLAASKGKVLAQATAPGAEDRNANTLWIDTSGTPPQNTPKRWVSGTTWAAVTDKAATDAATAAAKAIADAKAASDAAQSAADAAGNAMQAAGSKTKVYYSSSNPSGIAAVGDTWRKVDTNGDIIGEWRYTGGNPAWTAQLVTTQMISNVDIGKLTVGTAVMQQGVADEFFAKIFSTNKLFAENIIIGEAGNTFPDPFFADTEGWKPRAILPTEGHNGNPALEIAAAASQQGIYYGYSDRKRQMPVVGGSKYRVTVWVKADAATPANSVSVYSKWTNPSTAVTGVFATPQFHAPPLVANVWTPMTGIFEYPVDATRAMLGFYTQATANTRVLFSEPSVVRQIDDALVVEGGIKARSIEASEELSAKIASFLKVSTDQIVAGDASITSGVADRFYAAIFSSRKIYSNQIVVGQAGNIMPDPGHLDATMTKMRNDASTCTVTVTNTNDLALIATGTAYFRPLGIKQDTVNYKDWIPVQPGEVWEWGLTVVQMKTAGNIKFVGRTLDGSAYKNPSGTTTIPANATATLPYKVTVTIPADCYWICPEMTLGVGTQWVDQSSMYLRQVVTPALVVDGLVSGQNIIGAVIQTQPEANRGIKMSENGLVAYSNTGVETLRMDGANSIITGATLRTAASGTRIQISTAEGLEGWTGSTRYLKADANGLEMIGSISSKGKTAEATARDINVRLTTVTRNLLGISNVPNPAIVFDTGTTSLGTAPGIYSPQGTTLSLRGATGGISGRGEMDISETAISMNSANIFVGTGNLFATELIDVQAKNIILGSASGIFARSNITLNGDIVLGSGSRINGGTQHAQLTSTMSLVSSTNNSVVTGWSVQSSGSVQADFISVANGHTLVLDPGLYAITIQVSSNQSLGDKGRIAITGSGGAITYINTAINAGEWDGSLAMPNFFSQGNSNIQIQIRQTSGVTRTVSSRIAITKIS